MRVTYASHTLELPGLVSVALQADAARNHAAKNESVVIDTLQQKGHPYRGAQTGDGMIKDPMSMVLTVPCQRIYYISDLPLRVQDAEKPFFAATPVYGHFG